MDNSIKVALIISAAVILVALIGFFAYTSTETTDTINVQGLAEIKATPDLVTVYFRAETKADTAVEAKDENTVTTEKIKDNLIAIGFEEKEIITEGFNVYQEYDWEDGKRTEKGFVATHNMKVELKEEKFDLSGDVIDSVVDAGALLNYINFELSLDQQNIYKAAALRLATVDAKIKAEAIAEGLDKKLGKLVSASDSSFGYSPWPLFEARSEALGSGEIAVAKQAVTEIQPGEQTISARISAVYKI